MNTYLYELFYVWNGPSLVHPFAAEKEAAEIDFAFEHTLSEFRHRLDDFDAEIVYDRVLEEEPRLRVEVRTVESQCVVESNLERACIGNQVLVRKGVSR